MTRLNHLPLSWGLFGDHWMTHPSTRQRCEAIAGDHAIPRQRLEELLESADDTGGERFELPGDRVPGPSQVEPLFSAATKARTIQKIGWTRLAVLLTLPALGLLAVDLAGLVSGPRWTVLGVVAIACFGIDILLTNRLSKWGYGKLRRQLAHRLSEEGWNPQDVGAIFVGLAPHAEPRIYDGFYDWDVGFLVLGAEELCYLGDKTRFALPRERITEIRTAPCVAGWTPTERIEVRWQGDDEAGFGLLAAEAPTLTSTTPLARRIAGASRSLAPE